MKSTDRTEQSWDDVPDDIKSTFDRLGHPRSRAQVSRPASRRSTNPKSSITRSIEELEEARRAVLRHGYRAQAVSRDRSRNTSRPSSRPATTSSPRSTRAVWSGGSFVYVPPGVEVDDAAAGLLPDQHREHGPVRAHADHRRQRREGALHRGLHGAEVLDVVAALGGRRTDRDGRRVDPLHDDSELVPQHLQPRHQARRRVQERDGRVGRRQHRLAPDDEVSGHLPDGRRRARRDPLDGVRRRRPASGRRRESDPRGAEHDVGRHQQVASPRTAARRRIAAWSKSIPGAVGAKTRVQVRRADHGRALVERHEADDEDPRAALDRRTRSAASQDRRRAAVLRDEPRLSAKPTRPR